MSSKMLELLTDQGGGIETKTESGETHISWYTGHNRMFGVVTNTVETRRFLRNTLKRLEKEAQRSKHD